MYNYCLMFGHCGQICYHVMRVWDAKVVVKALSCRQVSTISPVTQVPFPHHGRGIA